MTVCFLGPKPELGNEETRKASDPATPPPRCGRRQRYGIPLQRLKFIQNRLLVGQDFGQELVVGGLFVFFAALDRG